MSSLLNRSIFSFSIVLVFSFSALEIIRAQSLKPPQITLRSDTQEEDTRTNIITA